jgi:hypothetical protein
LYNLWKLAAKGYARERRLGTVDVENAFIKHWKQEISVEDSLRKAKDEWDSFDGMETVYWWTDCGSEQGEWEADLQQTSIPDRGTVFVYQGFLPGLRRPERDVD